MNLTYAYPMQTTWARYPTSLLALYYPIQQESLWHLGYSSNLLTRHLPLMSISHGYAANWLLLSCQHVSLSCAAHSPISSHQRAATLSFRSARSSAALEQRPFHHCSVSCHPSLIPSSAASIALLRPQLSAPAASPAAGHTRTRSLPRLLSHQMLTAAVASN